jgi:hypothetical protein
VQGHKPSLFLTKLAKVFMNRSIGAMLVCLILAGCGTQMKVASVDEKTGLLKSEMGQVTKASVITAKKMPLAPFKGMAFITGGGDFGVNQLKEIKYFEQVVNFDDLQKLVIVNNLQDKVPSLNEPIGLNKLYRAYKPFLWIHFKQARKDNRSYLQLIATNPDTLDDVFVSEVVLDYVWAGVTDQNSRYPLFNALIEWLNQNR